MAEKKCNNCGTDKAPASVPFAVYESAMERAEWHAKSLVWIIVLLIVLLVGSNFAWLIYENSFEDVVTTEEVIVDAESDGVANYIGNDGDIYNGEDNGQKNN